MSKYQHLVVTLDTTSDTRTLEKTNERLNEYGDEGYELVCVVPDPDQKGEQSFFYFKRQVS